LLEMQSEEYLKAEHRLDEIKKEDMTI